MSRLWVGGATGFLGSQLVEQLLALGHEVVAISKGGGEVSGQRVQAVDVLDADAVEKSAAGCSGGFLATGKVSREPGDAGELHRVHVVGTRNALSGLRAAGVQRVVVASSSGTIAVGSDPEQIFDESSSVPLDLLARWPYYRSKLYAEREALERNDPPDFEVVVVNPSLLLGPGDFGGSSTNDIRLFLERSIPAVPSGGLAFVDVRDAARGMILALEKGRAGERYLLNAKNMTVGALFRRLERISGVRAPVLRMPKNRMLTVGANRLFSRALTAIGGKPPVDEVSVELAQYYWYCTAEKAERELGWEPRDPGETLRDTIDDLIERKAAFPRRDEPVPA